MRYDIPEPAAGRCVIRMETLRSKHIDLPENAKLRNRLPEGEVLKVGPPAPGDKGFPQPRVGDIVLFEEEYVRQMEIAEAKGDYWVFIKTQNIIAILGTREG